MRRARDNKNKPRPRFALGPGFSAYFILFIASVVFTQALRSPISVVLLWFMILLPIGMLLTALIARNGVTVFVHADETTSEKNVPVPYEFHIINSSIMPISYLEAYISVPSSDGVCCVEKRLLLSVLPKGRYRFANDIVFQYRGQYNVGVGDIYVSDALKLFTLKRTINAYYEMYILPRRIYLDRSTENAPSDLPTDSNTVVSGIESSETNRIREYRAGDSLKHIHWKLSSKMQDFQVNEYKPNTGKNVYVFCDFSESYTESSDSDVKKKRRKKKTKEKKKIKLNIEKKAPSSVMSTSEVIDAARESAAARAEAAAALAKSRKELTDEAKLAATADMNEINSNVENTQTMTAAQYFERANVIRPEYCRDMDYFCADGVSEIAIGAVMHEIEAGNTVTLMWFDNRVATGFCSYTLRSYSDLDLIFRQFATAPFVSSEYKVTRLPELIEDVENPTFLFASSKADLSTVADYVDAGNSMGAEAVEILFFNPKERYENPDLRTEYVETCRARFSENNITLSEVRFRKD